MWYHMANKYHIQFGAAKYKVIKRGRGKKSALKLNGGTSEEVSKYKYLAEMINNKGNLTDHITEIEKKVKGATATIIAATGSKELKGIEIQAIWQMVDAIIIPTSNGSWCMGIKGEMSGTVCVTFTWYMYIYELFIAFVCFVVCSLL